MIQANSNLEIKKAFISLLKVIGVVLKIKVSADCKTQI
jgi:hypothetical protein